MHISLPITAGRYLNTALRTGENVLVPKNLAKFPLSGDGALSQFGMIKGMALPILFFPSTLLNSISTLLIPEMSEASAKNQKGLVKNVTGSILKLSALISFIFAAIFLVAGEKIGLIIYKSPDVGFLIAALAPIVPFMYLDSIADGILKGLDQQAFSFRTAVSDSVIRIILILLILPVAGLNGFIGIMYFSNFFTCFLNIRRLCKISGARLAFFHDILLPVISAGLTAFWANFLLTWLSVKNQLIFLVLLCLISIPVYILLLFAFKITKKEEIISFIKR